MVIVFLQGGIGNQMFQYAAGRRLAYVNGVPLKVDLTRLGKHLPGVTPRCYALRHFCIKTEVATASETGALVQSEAGIISKIARNFVPGFRETHIRQRGFGFDPVVLTLSGSVVLDGYWQSEKYFEDIAPVIRTDFTRCTEMTDMNFEVADIMATCNAVSIHVRRGDYISDVRVAAKYATCSSDYYRKAVEAVLQMVSRPRFFVFSDDPRWVKEFFKIPYDMTVVGHNSPEHAHEDLWLMSLCKHHIIANSSFSWWGAWLNPNQDKIVIAPAQWFRDPSTRVCDLVPRSWLRIGL